MKKNKQIPWNKGKKLPPLSEEHKEKIRKTMKEKNSSGKNNPFYGRKHIEETKKKMDY